MSKPWDQRVRGNSPEHIAMLRAGQHAANARRRLGEGFLYLAEITDLDMLKIGHSLKPALRVKNIKINSKYRVKARLLAVTPGTFDEEHSLHAELRDHRALGHEFYPRSVLQHPAIPAGLRTPMREVA